MQNSAILNFFVIHFRQVPGALTKNEGQKTSFCVAIIDAISPEFLGGGEVWIVFLLLAIGAFQPIQEHLTSRFRDPVLAIELDIEGSRGGQAISFFATGHDAHDQPTTAFHFQQRYLASLFRILI